jgi:hypothetical protein
MTHFWHEGFCVVFFAQAFVMNFKLCRIAIEKHSKAQLYGETIRIKSSIK